MHRKLDTQFKNNLEIFQKNFVYFDRSGGIGQPGGAGSDDAGAEAARQSMQRLMGKSQQAKPNSASQDPRFGPADSPESMSPSQPEDTHRDVPIGDISKGVQEDVNGSLSGVYGAAPKQPGLIRRSIGKAKDAALFMALHPLKAGANVLRSPRRVINWVGTGVQRVLRGNKK